MRLQTIDQVIIAAAAKKAGSSEFFLSG